MTSSPRVSVVIPTYQRRASVQRLLEALGQQTLAPDEYEALVVVDGSDDGTREMVADFAAPYRLQALWQPNRGRAAACNTGVQAASGDVVVLLDDDMEPTPDFLAAHLAAQADGAARGVFGAVPIRLDPGSPPVLRYIGAKFNRHLDKLAGPAYTLQPRDFYSGNFSIRRQTLLAVGGFDEAFRIYGNEDIELSLRLVKAGVTLIYSPHALAYQHYTKDLAGLARDHRAKGRTSVLLAAKHPAVAPHLRLGAYHQGPRWWRLVRAGLLRLGLLYPPTSDWVLGAVRRMERYQPARLDRLYDLVLDLCYWEGVQAARAEQAGQPDGGRAPRLARKAQP